MHVSKVNSMFGLIPLHSYQDKLGNKYDVIFFNCNLTKMILQKCTMSVACDKVTVQTFVVCLSSVLPVVQYFKL